MRKVALVLMQGVVRSKVLRMRLRSRILRKHDLEKRYVMQTTDFFKMTPRLQSESTGESIISYLQVHGRIIKFTEFCGTPKMRYSVLERRLRDSKLEETQLDTLAIVFSR